MTVMREKEREREREQEQEQEQNLFCRPPAPRMGTLQRFKNKKYI